jgi:hypothetical protein
MHIRVSFYWLYDEDWGHGQTLRDVWKRTDLRQQCQSRKQSYPTPLESEPPADARQDDRGSETDASLHPLPTLGQGSESILAGRPFPPPSIFDPIDG